ncbi:MAG TPA: hypothetical protein VF538_19025 [Pyrinomonadaceae bacterium]|jgi:hypothetical protein
MPNDTPKPVETNRVLVKLRPSSVSALRAAESRAQLRPLHEGEGKQAQASAFGLDDGSALVVDLTVPEVKYRIVKNINSPRRQERTAAFTREAAADPLRALFLAPDRHGEPFASLHSLADDGF